MAYDWLSGLKLLHSVQKIVCPIYRITVAVVLDDFKENFSHLRLKAVQRSLKIDQEGQLEVQPTQEPQSQEQDFLILW